MDFSTKGWEFDEHHIGELGLRVIGNSDSGDVTIDACPIVGGLEKEVGRDFGSAQADAFLDDSVDLRKGFFTVTAANCRPRTSILRGVPFLV